MQRHLDWKGMEGSVRLKLDKDDCYAGALGRSGWRDCWLIQYDSFLVICADKYSTEPLDIVLAESNLDIKQCKHSKLSSKLDTLELTTPARHLFIRTRNAHQRRQWTSFLPMLEKSPWSSPHRFESFAPIHGSAKAKWYANATDYLYMLSIALDTTVCSIYIMDAKINPSLRLRSASETDSADWQLGTLLQKKAQSRVKICILTSNDHRDERITHENITWLQHDAQMAPRHHGDAKNQIQWEHHEKIVIVDSRIAFLGGIGLGFEMLATGKCLFSNYGPPDPIHQTHHMTEAEREETF